MIDTDIVSAQLSSSEAGDQLSNMSTSDAFADSNPPIYGFNVLQQFNGLTSKEKFYAHYMSKYGQLHFYPNSMDTLFHVQANTVQELLSQARGSS
jgi:hypothetical protein